MKAKIMSQNVTKIFRFSAAHRLLKDTGKCKNLHGHNYKAEISISGKLDKNQMIINFSDIKSSIGKWVDDNLDHTIILNKTDPLLKIIEKFNIDNKLKNVFITQGEPTVELLSSLIKDKTEGILKKKISIKLWETDDCYSELF